MQPNPVLKKLGFADDDRVVIIHTDDIGMCQASVAAFAELWDFGLIASGAVMVPCPWFPQAARIQREQPAADLGVHLTLTSEWATYRWGPLSTVDPASGLIDPEGFFYRSEQEVWQHGQPEAVQAELQAQVARALAFGMNPTHVDTHMGSVAHPKFIPGYVGLATQFGLPPMIMRASEEDWLRVGLDAETAKLAMMLVNQLEEMGVPLLDDLRGLELTGPAATRETRIEYAKEELGKLKAGITHFIIHPSIDAPELRAITPDWPYRVADYQAFGSAELRDFVRQAGIQVIGYAALKALMPT